MSACTIEELHSWLDLHVVEHDRCITAPDEQITYGCIQQTLLEPPVLSGTIVLATEPHSLGIGHEGGLKQQLESINWCVKQFYA